jgi:phenylacetate-CoA ligase
MFCVPQKEVVRYHASSGTTGTVVEYTENDIIEWSRSLARGLTSIGVGRGDVVQVSYGYGLFTGGFHYSTEMIGASAIPASSGNTERQIELMQDLGATTIACTPSYFLHDIFGTSEISGPLFSECQYQDGIHIWADQFLIEVVNPETGEQLPDGEREGELDTLTVKIEVTEEVFSDKISDDTREKDRKCPAYRIENCWKSGTCGAWFNTDLWGRHRGL